jgi:hypothetical protein
MIFPASYLPPSIYRFIVRWVIWVRFDNLCKRSRIVWWLFHSILIAMVTALAKITISIISTSPQSIIIFDEGMMKCSCCHGNSLMSSEYELHCVLMSLMAKTQLTCSIMTAGIKSPISLPGKCRLRPACYFCPVCTTTNLCPNISLGSITMTKLSVNISTGCPECSVRPDGSCVSSPYRALLPIATYALLVR